MVAGVCAGLAEYFGIDATLVRLAFVVLTFMGGSGVLVYIIAAIILPEKGSVDNWRPTGTDRHYYDATTVDEKPTDSGWQSQPADEPRQTSMPDPRRGGNNQALLAYILIGIGSYMLLERYVNWRTLIYRLRPFWPGVLIIVGLIVLLNSSRSRPS